jgi:hypothetical protein
VVRRNRAGHALVAAVSTAAVAKDVKQENRAAGPVQMTDGDMDKITAGTKTDNNGNAFGGGMGLPSDKILPPGQGAGNNNIHARF